jgi:hypothetical protein
MRHLASLGSAIAAHDPFTGLAANDNPTDDIAGSDLRQRFRKTG